MAWRGGRTMDCNTAWTLLPYAKPHAPELDPTEGLELQQHLESCPSCSTIAAHEQAQDETLGHAIRDVALPAGLKERLVNRLTTQRHERQRSRLLYLAVAAAA